jgi:hypothetical protein
MVLFSSVPAPLKPAFKNLNKTAMKTKPDYQDYGTGYSEKEYNKIKEFMKLEEQGKSFFYPIFKWQVHVIVFFIYGGIAWLMINFGSENSGYALLIVTLLLNSVWLIFRGFPMFKKWFFGLVE